MRTPEQLKGQIRSFSEKHQLMPQEVLQMYLFERVLERLAVSEFKENFILKGGLLISSMLGTHGRTTMDMDTTVIGIVMKEEVIAEIIQKILSIDVGDEITFQYRKIKSIREEDDYNNFRVYFDAIFGKICNPMKIDITTGDEITPTAIEFSYQCILDEKSIAVKAYNPETVIAEKFETIIKRNIGTTRARDFFDLLRMFELHRDQIEPILLRKAVENTCRKRGSENELSDWREICQEMCEDRGLQSLWKNYTQTNEYAGGLSFEEVIQGVNAVGKFIYE